MNDENNQKQTQSCSMTGLLGILIQLGLGLLSFSVLIIKRLRQRPQRPWKIWLFDTSKQIISQLLAHFINLTISIALSYNDDSSDQCLWYFMTNILDNTLGVLICVMCLRGIQWSLIKRNRLHYVSGNYYTKKKVIVEIQIMDIHKGQIKDDINIGIETTAQYSPKKEMNEQKIQQDLSQDIDPQNMTKIQKQTKEANEINKQNMQSIQKYQINYKAWLVQLLIWVSVVCIGKGVLFGFQYGLKNPLKNLSFFIMGWIQNYPVFQLLVVIIIVPVVMNGLAFWIQDNFLMKKQQNQVSGQNPLVQEQSAQRQPIL